MDWNLKNLSQEKILKKWCILRLNPAKLTSSYLSVEQECVFQVECNLGVVAISWAPSGVALETVMPQKNLTEICILSKSTRFMVIQVSQCWSGGFQSLSSLFPRCIMCKI